MPTSRFSIPAWQTLPVPKHSQLLQSTSAPGLAQGQGLTLQSPASQEQGVIPITQASVSVTMKGHTKYLLVLAANAGCQAGKKDTREYSVPNKHDWKAYLNP